MSKGNRKKKRRRQQAAARAAAQKKHVQTAAKPSEPEQGLAEHSSSTLERDIEPVEQSVKSQESEAKAEASSKDASVEPVEEQAVMRRTLSPDRKIWCNPKKKTADGTGFRSVKKMRTNLPRIGMARKISYKIFGKVAMMMTS